MASPYTSVSIANYNANAPADDGSEVASNQLTWAKHKTKLADPIKTLAEAINTNIVAAFGDRLLNAETQKTGAYTVTTSDRGALVNCTSNSFTVTLPAAATAADGFEVIIYNSGSGTITVDGNASETVNGSATVALETGNWLALRCDGSNWNGIGGTTGVTATNTELNLLDGVTATTAELNEVDASAAAVSNYSHGIRTYAHDDGGETTAFDIDANIGASWESIGPTSSGATNIWTAMDSIPAGASAAIVRVINTVTGSTTADSYSSIVYARKTGSAAAASSQNERSIANFINRSGSAETDAEAVEFTVPLDGSLRFDLYYSSGGTSPTLGVSAILVGFIV